jgi:hypothetical protein
VGTLCHHAETLIANGDVEGALKVIDTGLRAEPTHLCLLRLEGEVRIKLFDLPRARAAFQAFLQGGAAGKEARDAQQIVDDLTPVLSTFLDITAANGEQTGPVQIYVDSAGKRPLCIASPTCQLAMMPGVYTLIGVAGRPGFERWTGQATVDRGKTTMLRIALAQRPSLLTVIVTPADARIAVDGVPYGGPMTVAAGQHQVVVSSTGYAEQQQEIAASLGNPVVLDIALTPVELKSGLKPTTALVLSIGGTAASWGVIALAAQLPRSTPEMWSAGAIGAAGALLAPSFGHWYAGSAVTPGFILRVLGAAAVLGGIECVRTSQQKCPTAAPPLWLYGGALYVGGAIFDLGTTRALVRDSPRASASVTVVPMIHDDHRGFAIAGRF